MACKGICLLVYFFFLRQNANKSVSFQTQPKSSNTTSQESTSQKMKKEALTEVKVGAGIEILWRALAVDLRFIIPKIMPNLVKDMEVIEGDGGLGTVFLLNFGPGLPNMRYQKEKIVELDEKLHQIGIQLVEGGRLNLGFSSYKTSLQLTAIGERETQIDVKVAYEMEAEDTNHMPAEIIKSPLTFIQRLENYLLNGPS